MVHLRQGVAFLYCERIKVQSCHYFIQFQCLGSLDIYFVLLNQEDANKVGIPATDAHIVSESRT